MTLSLLAEHLRLEVYSQVRSSDALTLTRMSSLLLCVHSHPGANHRIETHWPYYEKSGADKIIGIGTTDNRCKWPDGVETANIGRDGYIDGQHLPKKLIDTMRFMLLLPYDRFCLIEWDCLFFKPLPEFTGMVGFHAGNRMGDMRTEHFHHCPWGWDFDAGMSFVTKADELLPQVSGHECSPDIFFSWVCQEAGLPVTQPWEGFSRNSLDCAGDLELARNAYLSGVMALHGVKGRRELDYVLS